MSHTTWMLRLNLSPPEKQQVPLTTDSSLQPPSFLFEYGDIVCFLLSSKAIDIQDPVILWLAFSARHCLPVCFRAEKVSGL